MKVLILGAGASFGHGVPGVANPPLVDGFLEQALLPILKKDYEPLFKYILDLSICDLSVDQLHSANIEKLFANIEPLWRLNVFGDDQTEVVNRYGECFKYVTPLDMLHSLIVDVISLSTEWLIERECPFHQTLVDRWLKPGDVVISLNYDLIMDKSLKRTSFWRESTGYGWMVTDKAEQGYIESDIHLFKLHGSLNWHRKKSKKYIPDVNEAFSKSEEHETISVSNVSDITQQQEGTLWKKIPPKIGPGLVVPPFKPKGSLGNLFYSMAVDSTYPLIENELLPLMVMPTPYKPFAEMMYGELKIVWQKARRAIQDAQELWICGYSLKDPHLNQLIAESCRGRQIPLGLFIVDKKSETTTNAKKIFKAVPVKPEFAFDSLESFAGSIS